MIAVDLDYLMWFDEARETAGIGVTQQWPSVDYEVA